VKDLVVARTAIPESELGEVLGNGVSRIGNQIDWARFYLARSGHLDSSKRGVWALTELGRNARLSAQDVRRIAREVNAKSSGNVPQSTIEVDGKQRESEKDETIPQHADHRGALLATIKRLPPAGFEKLCRYLLLESGFEAVTITGRSGDGGIDGHGILRVNKLVSMTVLFQCKRFDSSVSASRVRDFRGALSGRAEKGIILTTAYFTPAAEQRLVGMG
jgi:restriction system protein